MKKSTFRIVASTAILSLGIAVVFAISLTKEKPAAVKTSNNSEKSSEDFEFLKALPYVQWTDTKGTENQRGVTLFDSKLSYNGYNLYTNDEDKVYLTDMRGKQLNVWSLPGKNNCEYAELMPDGSVVVVCANQGIARVDWNSKPVWDHELRIHHDVELLPDESYFTLLRQRTQYKSLWVVFDSIIHVSPSGEILQRWNTADKVQQISKFHKPHPMEVAGEQEIRKNWKKK